MKEVSVSQEFTTPTFADYFVEIRKQTRKSFLDDVHRLIDWKPIEKILKKKYRKVASADGRPAYPPLPMFKLLLLQRWYGLSDPGLEDTLYDRISFIRFSGFSLGGSLPDHSTICRFRNALMEVGIYEKLFGEVSRQIESHGLLVKEGAIVDATIVESSRRPRKVIEIIPEDRCEEETDTPPPQITYSDDHDATWVRKGKKPYYGYKAHVVVDTREGFVLNGHVTPAHVADTTEFEKLMENLSLPDTSPVCADKGYASKKNRDLLAARGYEDAIMHKAARGKPLTPFQRLMNRIISSVRYRVEQGMGTLKKHYGFTRMRYRGLSKGNMEFLLNAMAFNLKKAVRMIET
jgi:transposase, IS5 family